MPGKTKRSESNKIRYANGPVRIKANKKRKLDKHIRKQPNDKQATEARKVLG